MMARGTIVGVGALFAMLGCGSPEESLDAAVDGGHVPHLSVPDVDEPRCAMGDDYAPLRTGELESECIQVGADRTVTSGEFPAVPSPAPAGPIVYVRPGASGDGSIDNPFGDLATALASNPGAVLLARGTHTITANVVIDADAILVGTGVEDGTTVLVEGDFGALTIGATSASISGLAIEYAAPCGIGIAIDAAAGATLTLTDVAIRNAAEALRATGATVTANGLTVQNACVRGIGLLAASSGVLDDVLVRDGGTGIEVDSAHVELSHAFVTENTGGGVRIHGAASGGDDVISLVAFQCNTLVGLEIDGAITVNVSGAELSGTFASASGRADGLVVRGGATVAFDSAITDVADRGKGSQLIANARAGLIVDGAGSTLSMHGAFIASNGMTGVFVQNGAAISALAESDIRANTGAGVVVSGGSLVGFQCNTIQGTRVGTVATNASIVSVGDALSVSASTAAMAVTASDFARNDGFAAVFYAGDAVFTTSTGTCNGHAVGIYDGANVTVDTTNAIDGNAPLPGLAPPHIVGSLAL